MPSLEEIAARLALWRGYEQELATLSMYAVGIALYTLVVFTSYDRVSRTEVFHTKKARGAAAGFVRFLESIFLLPAMSFVYWAVLALALFLLAKTQTTAQILLLSMSVVVGVRAMAFVHQNMAVDLAKVVPLGLLGVLLVDPGYLTVETPRTRLLEAAAMTPFIFRAFVFLVVLESALQATRWTFRKITKKTPQEVAHRVLRPTGPHPGPAAPREFEIPPPRLR